MMRLDPGFHERGALPQKEAGLCSGLTKQAEIPQRSTSTAGIEANLQRELGPDRELGGRSRRVEGVP